jgi:hypothetical protein
VEAARKMPETPNSPNLPVGGGTKGVQFCGFTNEAPITMKVSRTTTLMATMTLFTDADSRTPRVNRAVTPRMPRAATRFTFEVAANPCSVN